MADVAKMRHDADSGDGVHALVLRALRVVRGPAATSHSARVAAQVRRRLKENAVGSTKFLRKLETVFLNELDDKDIAPHVDCTDGEAVRQAVLGPDQAIFEGFF